MNTVKEAVQSCPSEESRQSAIIFGFDDHLQSQDHALSWWLLDLLRDHGWMPFAATTGGDQIVGYHIYHFRNEKFLSKK
jgi:hypothetical protein